MALPDNRAHLYSLLGEDGIARLVDRHYHWMQTLPEVRPVLAMHALPLDETKARLRAFLSGWLGGPDRYRPRYGEPFMRRRHLPFPIDAAARDQWLLCMRHALADVIEQDEARRQLEAAFAAMAEHMRNRP
jgi:Truncated hemoglobins